jgi:hypothetical protein
LTSISVTAVGPSPANRNPLQESGILQQFPLSAAERFKCLIHLAAHEAINVFLRQ